MLKKIPGPEEKKTKKIDSADIKKRQAIAKFSFLCIIGLSMLIAYLLVKQRENSTRNQPPDTQSSESQSLGIQDEKKYEDMKKKVDESLKKAVESAETSRETIETTTQQAVEEGKEVLENTVNDAVNQTLYNTALKPVIEKIHALPSPQQEYIKEQLCR